MFSTHRTNKPNQPLKENSLYGCIITTVKTDGVCGPNGGPDSRRCLHCHPSRSGAHRPAKPVHHAGWSAFGRPVGIDQRSGLPAGRRRWTAGICRRYRRSRKIRWAYRRIPAGVWCRRLSDRHYFGKRSGACDHRCAGHGCRHIDHIRVRRFMAQGGHGNQFFQGINRGHVALSHRRRPENCSCHTHRQGSYGQ